MSEDDNVKILREAYHYWSDNPQDGVARWMDLLAETVQWRSLADGATGMEFSRTRSSKEQVARYFDELANDWEMQHYMVNEFVAQGDRVVVIGSCGWKHKRTGKVVETPKVDVLRMKDGKIVEFSEFYDTAKAIAASQDK